MTINFIPTSPSARAKKDEQFVFLSTSQHKSKCVGSDDEEEEENIYIYLFVIKLIINYLIFITSLSLFHLRIFYPLFFSVVHFIHIKLDKIRNQKRIKHDFCFSLLL